MEHEQKRMMSNEQTKDAMELKSNKKPKKKKTKQKITKNKKKNKSEIKLGVKEIETFEKLAANSERNCKTREDGKKDEEENEISCMLFLCVAMFCLRFRFGCAYLIGTWIHTYIHNFCFNSEFRLHLEFSIKATTASSIRHIIGARVAYMLFAACFSFSCSFNIIQSMLLGLFYK